MPVSNATDRDLAHRWFHTLSDETRLQLLELLREGEQCVCDLTDALGPHSLGSRFISRR
jgi:ArsR family transcriptional regulator